MPICRLIVPAIRYVKAWPAKLSRMAVEFNIHGLDLVAMLYLIMCDASLKWALSRIFCMSVAAHCRASLK